jgi:aromatic ring-cleaving dioxygenase
MEKELHAVLVTVLIKVVKAICIKRAGSADDAMYLVSFGEQEFSQIGPVLTCYTRN